MTGDDLLIDWLLTIGTYVTAALMAWLLFAVVLAAISARHEIGRFEVLVPAWLRRLVLSAMVAGASYTPAVASAQSTPPIMRAESATTTVVTTTTSVPVAPPAPAAPVVAPPVLPATVVVVQPGDSFWSIARADLQTRASNPGDDEIAQRWRAIIDANRDRLRQPGNPNLIYPGQEFVLPPN